MIFVVKSVTILSTNSLYFCLLLQNYDQNMVNIAASVFGLSSTKISMFIFYFFETVRIKIIHNPCFLVMDANCTKSYPRFFTSFSAEKYLMLFVCLCYGQLFTRRNHRYGCYHDSSIRRGDILWSKSE